MVQRRFVAFRNGPSDIDRGLRRIHANSRLWSGALDGDAEMRRAAFGQLATLGTDECVEGLSIALRDNDATIVTEAVKGLGGSEANPPKPHS